MYIYAIKNDINSKVYIGRTVRSIEARWKEHLSALEHGDCRNIYCAMRKYGANHFYIEELYSTDNLEDLSEKEAYFVQLFDSYCNGYNMTVGGDANPMENEKSKASHDNKMRSSDVRQKISATMSILRKNDPKNIYIHKGHAGRRIEASQLDEFLAAGWELGSNQKLKITIVKDNIEKRIWIDELPSYEAEGWEHRGKSGRISKKHRKALDESRYKSVYCLSETGDFIMQFNSLKEATEWWFMQIPNPTPGICKEHYSLANYIKQSATQNQYIYNLRWVYGKYLQEGGDETNGK